MLIRFVSSKFLQKEAKDSHYLSIIDFFFFLIIVYIIPCLAVIFVQSACYVIIVVFLCILKNDHCVIEMIAYTCIFCIPEFLPPHSRKTNRKKWNKKYA